MNTEVRDKALRGDSRVGLCNLKLALSREKKTTYFK